MYTWKFGSIDLAQLPFTNFITSFHVCSPSRSSTDSFPFGKPEQWHTKDFGARKGSVVSITAIHPLAFLLWIVLVNAAWTLCNGPRHSTGSRPPTPQMLTKSAQWHKAVGSWSAPRVTALILLRVLHVMDWLLVPGAGTEMNRSLPCPAHRMTDQD